MLYKRGTGMGMFIRTKFTMFRMLLLDDGPFVRKDEGSLVELKPLICVAGRGLAFF